MSDEAKTDEPNIPCTVEQVLKIILLGAEFHDLRDYADEVGWKVTDVKLRKMQSQALDMCKDSVERDPGRIFSRHVMQRRRLYTLAVESGDYRAALAVARDEAQLLDVYPDPKKPEPVESLPVDCSVEAKVNHVLRWILAGANEADVNQLVGKQWPEDEARPLIEKAIAGLLKPANFSPDAVLGFCFEATRDAHRRMIEEGDHAGALKAIKQLAELAEHVRGNEQEADGNLRQEEGPSREGIEGSEQGRP